MHLQHGARTVEHCASGGAEILGRSSRAHEVCVEGPQRCWCGGVGRWGEPYLGGGGLQSVQLVHSEA